MKILLKEIVNEDVVNGDVLMKMLLNGVVAQGEDTVSWVTTTKLLIGKLHNEVAFNRAAETEHYCSFFLLAIW